jgi:RNA polymerase sigma-70 factor (ECF subfamily)
LSPDDSALLRRLRAGDDDAFAGWVRSESPRLLAVARRILRDDDDAHDAVQEAFLSAWRSLERFEGGSRLSTWLHRVAVNSALMRLRSRRRRREDSIEELLPGFAEDGHHAATVPAWSRHEPCPAERREVNEIVRDCIDRLPESHRVVLILRDVEGLDTAEAAQALGVSAEALKMRLHRARQALRTLLEPFMTETPSRPTASGDARGSGRPAQARRSAPGTRQGAVRSGAVSGTSRVAAASAATYS